MKKRKFSSLNWKLFIVFVLILSCSVLLVGITIYRYFLNYARESIDQSTQIIVDNHAKTVSDFFRRDKTLNSLLIAEIPSFMGELEDISSTEDEYVILRHYNSIMEKLTNFCDAAVGADNRYRAYMCFHSQYAVKNLLPSPDDSYFIRSAKDYSKPYCVPVNEENLTDSDWYNNSSRNNSFFWFMFPDNNDTIWLAQLLDGTFLVNNTPTYYSIGTFVIGIDVSWITEQLDDCFPNSNSLFYISDLNNRIIYSKDTSFLNQTLNELYTSEKDSSAGSLLVSRDGITYHVWQQIVNNDIVLTLLVPVQYYNTQVWGQLKMLIGVTILIIAIGLGISAYFSLYITRPIKQLSQHMEQPELTAIQPYKANDEIGALYQSFNAMVEKQELLISEIYDYSEEQKQLRFQVLQAQINPHFLYNTLDSVGCVALMHGESELTDILSSLVDLLRYNIHEPEQLVTLQDEIKMTEDYIAIQQFRYDNQLLWSYRSEPMATATQIPKTIIQPLVENGIFYGDVGPGRRRRVSLLARCDTQENTVVIEVQNDVAADKNVKEIAVLLNQYLLGKREIKRNSTGIGILNIQQRIQYVFGQKYGLKYEANNSSLTARITIPIFNKIK